MATRAADDFVTIGKRLEELKREQRQILSEGTETPATNATNKVTVAEDREPTPSADYGLCYTNELRGFYIDLDQYYTPFNLDIKD